MKKRVVSMLLIGCLGAALLVGCGNEKTDANAGEILMHLLGQKQKQIHPEKILENILQTIRWS